MKLSIILYLLSFSHPSFNYYSQIGQDKFVHELLGNKKNGIFIDIGAYDGIEFSNSYFFEKELGWTGICIEPLPFAFERLIKNRSCICINGCIANFNGKAPFLKIANSDTNNYWPQTLSGLIEKYDPYQLALAEFVAREQSATMEIIETSCLILNDLLEKNNITHIDYLSLDTEGGELEILKSIDFDRFDIDIIDAENNFINGKQDTQVQEFLLSKGFILIKKIEWDDIYRNKKYL